MRVGGSSLACWLGWVELAYVEAVVQGLSVRHTARCPSAKFDEVNDLREESRDEPCVHDEMRVPFRRVAGRQSCSS